MYYAAVNSYATSTSVGFANTWSVIGFQTRAMRAAYIQSADDLATRAILSKEIRSYGAKHGEVNFYDADGYLNEFDSWVKTHRQTAVKINIATGKLEDDGIDHDAVDAYWDELARKDGYID